jgi:hypothetical protein
VCANTNDAAIAGARASFAISHTDGARLAIQEARSALRLSWRYMDAFEAEAAALYAAPMDLDEVRSLAAEPVKVDQAVTTTGTVHQKRAWAATRFVSSRTTSTYSAMNTPIVVMAAVAGMTSTNSDV